MNRLHLEKVPEFNGTKPPPPTPISMLRDLKTKAARLRKRAPATPPEPPKVDETADESALVGAFIGRVGVDPVRGSHLVDVTFTAEDPKFAAEAVNTLVDEYVSENLEIKLQVDAGHARLAGQGAREPAEAGRGEREGARPNTARRKTRCRSTTSRTSCCRGSTS